MCRWVAYFSPQPILLSDVVSLFVRPSFKNETSSFHTSSLNIDPRVLQIERPKHSIIKQSECTVPGNHAPHANRKES